MFNFDYINEEDIKTITKLTTNSWSPIQKNDNRRL